jgi:hypothetical protein
MDVHARQLTTLGFDCQLDLGIGFAAGQAKCSRMLAIAGYNVSNHNDATQNSQQMQLFNQSRQIDRWHAKRAQLPLAGT